MKIALINNLYSQQKRGGAEIIVENLKQALEKEGHDCFVISTAPKKTIKQTQKKLSLNSKNHNTKNYLISSLYYHLQNFPYIIRLIWHLYKQLETHSVNKVKTILEAEKPDLIISHNLTGLGTRIYSLIKKLDIYHVHYLHDTQMLHPAGRMIYQQENIINSWLARLYQKIQKKYSQQTDLIVSPSKWLLNLHQERGFFKNTRVWQKFNPLKQNKVDNIKQNSKFTFIYIGQIDKEKGIELMIKAFLKTKNDQAILKIIGDGKDLNILKQRYDKQTNIIFSGRKSYQESMQELKAANTLILPSLIYENCPTALFDALKLNKNIIASNLGGNKEIISKYYGDLVMPNNINSLSQAMQNSLDKNKQRKEAIDLSDLQPQVYIKELLNKLHFS